MTPLWIRVVMGDADMRASFEGDLDKRITDLQQLAAEGASSWEAVLMDRARIEELRRLKSLLKSEEETNVRRIESAVRNRNRNA